MLCVVDTNVILAANGAHAELSAACVDECIAALQELMAGGVVVIDDAFHILSEYQHKTSASAGKQAGDVFLKWLLRNCGNPAFCQQVTLHEYAENCFAEFPLPGLEKQFDPSDRKFVATANAHPGKPVILQAADSKWLNWFRQLQDAGIHVQFLCHDDLCRFYAKKFPGEKIPTF